MSIAPSASSAALPVPVLDEPHWRVRIRPAAHTPNRIASLARCWEITERSRVRLRGWDYPHVEAQQREHGRDFIASWINWTYHLEYWRLYQSGQFISLNAIRERGPQGANAWRSSAFGVPVNFVPRGFLEYVDVLFSLSEFYKFAANLAMVPELENFTSIEISLNGVRDFVLYNANFEHSFHGFFHATIDAIDLPSLWLSGVQTESSIAAHAASAAAWLYERFGWLDSPREILQRDADAYLAGTYFR